MNPLQITTVRGTPPRLTAVQTRLTFGIWLNVDEPSTYNGLEGPDWIGKDRPRIIVDCGWYGGGWTNDGPHKEFDACTPDGVQAAHDYVRQLCHEHNPAKSRVRIYDELASARYDGEDEWASILDAMLPDPNSIISRCTRLVKNAEYWAGYCFAVAGEPSIRDRGVWSWKRFSADQTAEALAWATAEATRLAPQYAEREKALGRLPYLWQIQHKVLTGHEASRAPADWADHGKGSIFAGKDRGASVE